MQIVRWWRRNSPWPSTLLIGLGGLITGSLYFAIDSTPPEPVWLVFVEGAFFGGMTCMSAAALDRSKDCTDE